MILLGYTDERILSKFIRLENSLSILFFFYVFEGFIDFRQIMILRLLLNGWENEYPSSERIIAQKIQLTQSTLR